MGDILRPAGESDIAPITETLLATRLFRDAREIRALCARTPWRVQITDSEEVALLRRHPYLPLLLVEGLFCEEVRIPSLVDAVARVARAQGCQSVVSPLVDGPGSRPYQHAGMREYRRVATFEMGRPQRGTADAVDRPIAGSIEDAEEILALDAQAFEPFWRFDREWIDRLLPEAHVLLVRGRERLEGFILFGVNRQQGHVMRLAVHPLARRRGVAAALLAKAVATMGEEGARSVTVTTQTDNEAARSLYRRAGFRESPAPLAVLISDML